MTREYDEKRDFIRIDIDCDITYKTLDSDEEELVGKVANLSGRGMMFISDDELEKNRVLEINIKPKNILTPALHANVKVVRVVKQRHAEGYEIGAVIKEIYNDKE
ncbi:MAG: PilZ domain-containing protein [Gammaproteobacteria bacterium]|nr:PilZ domain-containing protein [Gammaproteobacteria bacterium]